MIECWDCRTEKEDVAFENKRPGHRRAVCSVCMLKRKFIRQNGLQKEWTRQKQEERRKKRRDKLRVLVDAYLSERGCIECGESNPQVLQFDHVRGEKYKNVSWLIKNGKSLESVCAEISKCEVRCANCHQLKTNAEFGYP